MVLFLSTFNYVMNIMLLLPSRESMSYAQAKEDRVRGSSITSFHILLEIL
jgi:hypothetical protein